MESVIYNAEAWCERRLAQQQKIYERQIADWEGFLNTARDKQRQAETHIYNLETRLEHAEGDVRKCVDVLTGIWGDAFGTPSVAAKEALQDLWTTVECPFCEGSGRVLCGHCSGGGTTEHYCHVCCNSGDVRCQECEGEGKI